MLFRLLPRDNYVSCYLYSVTLIGFYDVGIKTLYVSKDILPTVIFVRDKIGIKIDLYEVGFSANGFINVFVGDLIKKGCSNSLTIKSYHAKYIVVYEIPSVQYPMIIYRNRIFDPEQINESFEIKLARAKLRYGFDFRWFLIVVLSTIYIFSKSSRRVLIATKQRNSDFVFASNFFKSKRVFCYVINSLKYRFNFSHNKYVLYANSLEMILASFVSESINKSCPRFVYVSLPGAFVVKEILNYLSGQYYFIHIAHGRISSEKFLVKTDAVFTQVLDDRYKKLGIKQIEIKSFDTIRYEPNGVALLYHGYSKGNSYSILNLFRDIKISNKLLRFNEIIIIKPHPSAFLLRIYLKFQINKRIVFGTSDYYEVETVYSLSPTISKILKKLSIQFVDLVSYE